MMTDLGVATTDRLPGGEKAPAVQESKGKFGVTKTELKGTSSTSRKKKKKLKTPRKDASRSAPRSSLAPAQGKKSDPVPGFSSRPSPGKKTVRSPQELL